MTFGTSFDPNNDLRKNAFGVPEYRGFRMLGGEMYSPNEISQPHQPDNASSPQKKELSEAERLMLAGTYGVMTKELT
ncbi:hypothetical protein [Fundidesulfovibrio putealis]|uniref:hypothetical protein n=1 Tax=Fundidesulfovibrio putealis TaxID=270496 RepID=UPI0012EBFD9D|nr:hypothetical protein [Fundidesulfovibrio putealis]